MAISGRKLDERTRREVVRLREAGLSIRQTAHAAFVSVPTVQKILGKRR